MIQSLNPLKQNTFPDPSQLHKDQKTLVTVVVNRHHFSPKQICNPAIFCRKNHQESKPRFDVANLLLFEHTHGCSRWRVILKRRAFLRLRCTVFVAHTGLIKTQQILIWYRTYNLRRSKVFIVSFDQSRIAKYRNSLFIVRFLFVVCTVFYFVI